jgi:hypothetical protein
LRSTTNSRGTRAAAVTTVVTIEFRFPNSKFKLKFHMKIVIALVMLMLVVSGLEFSVKVPADDAVCFYETISKLSSYVAHQSKYLV